MLFRIPFGALLAAVVTFVWGMLWWTQFAGPVEFHKSLPRTGELVDRIRAKLPEQLRDKVPTNPTQGVEDDTALVEALRHLPGDGVYFYPLPEEREGDDSAAVNERWMKHMAEGPIFQIFYHEGGAEPMAMTMAKGFAQQFSAALIAALLLALAGPGQCCYPMRVFFVLLLGLFAAVWARAADPIWWHHPVHYSLFQAGYDVSSWLLAGLVLGLVVKRQPAV